MCEGWLDCTISPGQFTGEFAIRGKMFDGTEFSLFAPKEYLEFEEEPSKDKSVNGRMRVIIGPREDDLIMINLPRPTFENGQGITVKAEQIMEIAH